MTARESTLQTDCNNHLRLLKIKFIHHEKGRGKNKTHRGGIPDLIIFMPKGVTLSIELKRNSKEKMKDRQKAWFRYLNENDYKVFCCWDIDNFKRIIGMYL